MNTFDAWKAAVERNNAIARTNGKKNTKSNLIKALLLLSLFVVGFGFFLNYAPYGLAEDGSNFVAIALTTALVLIIPSTFLMIIVLTPPFFKLEPYESITLLRDAWAKAHGLDAAKELPNMHSFLSFPDEQVFIQRFGDELKTYRLVNEGGNGVLYDAEGNRVDSKAAAVTFTGVTVDDPNSELWKTARDNNTKSE